MIEPSETNRYPVPRALRTRMAAAAAAAVGDVGDDRQKIRKALLQVDNFKRANKVTGMLATPRGRVFEAV